MVKLYRLLLYINKSMNKSIRSDGVITVRGFLVGVAPDLLFRGSITCVCIIAALVLQLSFYLFFAFKQKGLTNYVVPSGPLGSHTNDALYK